MISKTKFTWLSVLLGVAMIVIATESYFLWDLDKDVKNVEKQELSAFWPHDNTPWLGFWDPGDQFMQMQKQMNRLMNQMSAGNPFFSQHSFGLSPSSPRITMKDESDKYKVEVKVPKGEDVEINTKLKYNQLTINGTVKQSGKNHSGSYSGQSLAISEFSQTMNFPDAIDDSGVKMKRDHNKIVITVPKIS